MLREAGLTRFPGSDNLVIEVHLYGKLRRFAESEAATSQSVVCVEALPGDTVQSLVDRLGISLDELGSSKFLNGRYADLETTVKDGDRLGLFPDDMQLLYKWYFAPGKVPATEKPSEEQPQLASRKLEEAEK